MDPTDTAFQFAPGDTAWIICAMALVWLMIPGLAYFYSGLSRSKNALTMMMASFICLMVASIQWFIWGYSLVFSNDSGSPFLGNLNHSFLRGLLGYPSPGNPKIPDLIFAVYQGMFACVTPALVTGAAAERARLVPLIVFVFVWSTLVYDVLAYWTWNANGWSYQMGGLDFAGGTPVHIGSGFSSLAYALMVGPRVGDKHEFKPHNMSNVMLGTALLWFGWFGFNGGSALSSNTRAAMACIVTNLAACVGAATWMALDYYYRVGKKLSAFAFCSGAIAGLVAITPAAGFVGPAPAVAVGFLGAFFCYLAVLVKDRFGFDDAFDVFTLHGVGGYVGCILTGLFAEPYVAALDGSYIAGGWMNHNWIQIGHQFADATAGAAWSFCISYIILFIINKIPGLSLRATEQDEIMGLDAAEIGENAYGHIHKILISNGIPTRPEGSKETTQ